MSKVLRNHPFFQNRDTHGFDDDFDHIIEGQSSAGTATDIGTPPWTETGDAGGETTLSDAVGGQIQLNTDADDNDEWYFYRTRETFLFADDKPLRWEARLQFAEVDTNAVNIMVGVMDAIGADSLVDNGGGPKASYSGMVMFKEDGQLNWTFEASDSTTQLTTRSDSAAASASSAFTSIAAEFMPETSTRANCVGYLDTTGGNDFVQLRDTTDNVNNEIAHKLVFSNATEMTFVIGIKAGSANAVAVTADYAACYQTR